MNFIFEIQKFYPLAKSKGRREKESDRILEGRSMPYIDMR